LSATTAIIVVDYTQITPQSGPNWITPLYIWTVLNSVIFNKKQVKTQVAVSKNVNADKYYQTEKPDEFLFIM